uniref:Zinc finger protein 525-like isoform X3 n=1 Tax=Diabrotica virgifera virgifera TaxID=50390 RepID=A0A6P7F1Q5_DIAVI
MEIKQEAMVKTYKIETYNEASDGSLDVFKIEIKEEPKRGCAYDAFDYGDLKNEFPLKTEIEDEYKLTSFEEKQTKNEESSPQEDNKTEIMETSTAHPSHKGKCNRPYKCETCFKQFTRPRNLKIHLRVHNGEKPHKCEICFKQFSERGTLKRHLRVHTGEKPYKCEVCCKQFSQKANLECHLIQHTGEKQYKCEICFKQFSERGTLKRRLRVHTGENLTSVVSKRIRKWKL